MNNSPDDTMLLDPFSLDIECDVDGSSTSNKSEELLELLDLDNDSIWQPSYNDDSVKDDDKQIWILSTMTAVKTSITNL